ncbi:MAG TPA: nitroreductase family deazaflavin-dependent oxidoreductase [Jiangellaceae bacterium]|nr:nitroreductase family deazaflavin-dependent oxidoreductase [Jiangellaceae bacterium]
MIIAKSVARFNRVVTNRISSLVAGRLPGFGIVEHIGRRSGRTYRTPVNVFRTSDGYVIALTYGSDTDWVKNVLAAGGCSLTVRGRRENLGNPRIVHNESRPDVPVVVRPMLGLIGVTEFLYLADR